MATDKIRVELDLDVEGFDEKLKSAALQMTKLGEFAEKSTKGLEELRKKLQALGSNLQQIQKLKTVANDIERIGKFSATASKGVLAFESNLKRLAAAFKEIKKLRTLDSDIAALGRAAEAASTKVGNLASANTRLTYSFDAAKMAAANANMRAYGASSANAATGVSKLAAAQTRYANSLGKSTSITSTANSLVTIGPAAIRAASGMDRVTKSGGGMLDTITKVVAIGGLFQSFVNTIWMATGGWTKAILDANGEIERLKTLLNGMSRKLTLTERMEEANEQMEKFISLASNSPFSLGQLSKSAVKLKSAGIDPLAGGFESLIDAVASFGGTDEILDRSSIAIQQMSGKGIISMEELRQQLGEAVPNAMALMARATGATMKEFVKQVSTGTVVAGPALESMFNELGRSFDGSAERMMNTWSGMTKRLTTEWQKFLLKIGEAGFFEEGKKALEGFIEILSSDAAVEFAQSLGRALTVFVQFVSSVVKFTVNNAPLLLNIMAGISAVIGVRLVASLGKAVLSFLSFGKGIAAAGKALTSLVTLTNVSGGVASLAASILGIGTSASVAATRLATLRAAFSTLLGPISLIVGALTAVGVATYKWISDGSSALRELRDGAQLTTTQIKDALKNLDFQVKKLDTLEWIRSVFGLMSDYSAERDGIMVQQVLLAKQAEDNMVAAVEVANDKLKRAYDERFGIVQSNYNDQATQMDQQYESDSNRERQMATHVAIIRQRTKDLVLIYDDMITDLKKKLGDLNRSGGPNTEAFQLANLQLQQILKQRGEILKSGEKDVENVFANEQRSIDQSVRTSSKILEDYIVILEANANKSTAAVTGASAEVAKFMVSQREELETLKKYNPESYQRYIDQVREYGKAIEEANESKKRLTAAEGAEASVKSLMVEETERLMQAYDSLDPSLSSSSKKIEELDIKMAKMLATFVESGRSADEFKQSIEELKSVAKEVEAVNFLSDMSSDIQKAALESLPQIEQDFIKHRLEMAKIYRDTDLAASYAQDEEIKQKIIEASQVRIAQLQRKYDEERVSFTNELAKRYAFTYEDLISTSADFFDGFLENIGKGAEAFSDFAESMIKDIIKIMLQYSILKMLGKETGGGLEAGGSSLGGFITQVLGSLVGGAIGSSVSTPTTALGIDQGNGVTTYALGQTQQAIPLASVPSASGFSSAQAVSRSLSTNTPLQSRPVDVSITNRSGTNLGATSANFDVKESVLNVVLDGMNSPGAFRQNIRQAVG